MQWSAYELSCWLPSLPLINKLFLNMTLTILSIKEWTPTPVFPLESPPPSCCRNITPWQTWGHTMSQITSRRVTHSITHPIPIRHDHAKLHSTQLSIHSLTHTHTRTRSLIRTLTYASHPTHMHSHSLNDSVVHAMTHSTISCSSCVDSNCNSNFGAWQINIDIRIQI